LLVFAVLKTTQGPQGWHNTQDTTGGQMDDGLANTVFTHTAGGAWHPQTVMLITFMRIFF